MAGLDCFYRITAAVGALAMALSLLGCQTDQAAETAQTAAPTAATQASAASSVGKAAPSRRLCIDATETEVDEINYLHQRSEEDGVIFVVSGLKAPTIELEGVVWDLEEAIWDGAITVEEIFYYAALDAKNGFCTESYTSRNGLASFRYAYPELDVELVHDVYETPDGEQHRICDVKVLRSGLELPMTRTDPQTWMPIDREDWGLSFQVEEATPTGLSLRCTQAGGQQLGTLVADCFRLYQRTSGQSEWSVPPALDGSEAQVVSLSQAQLPSDGTAILQLEWEEAYGALPSGEYRIALHLLDLYDKTQVPELMLNFYDRQTYYIEFAIP